VTDRILIRMGYSSPKSLEASPGLITAREGMAWATSEAPKWPGSPTAPDH